MSSPVPRLRMFAGPNGSGKSTVKAQVDQHLWGQFINADNIEAELRRTKEFNFGVWGIETQSDEVYTFFQNSWVSAKRTNWQQEIESMIFEGSLVGIGEVAVNSYLATVIADFLREKLLAQRASFTFETVMSDRNKVRLLERARSQGYRTYLYYVATEDPSINVDRVAKRVKAGGHPVPENKIRERYTRSLDLLMEAINASDRAYLWDNSGTQVELLAECEAGVIAIKSVVQPSWFQTYVLSKIAA